MRERIVRSERSSRENRTSPRRQISKPSTFLPRPRSFLLLRLLDPQIHRSPHSSPRTSLLVAPPFAPLVDSREEKVLLHHLGSLVLPRIHHLGSAVNTFHEANKQQSALANETKTKRNASDSPPSPRSPSEALLLLLLAALFRIRLHLLRCTAAVRSSPLASTPARSSTAQIGEELRRLELWLAALLCRRRYG